MDWLAVSALHNRVVSKLIWFLRTLEPCNQGFQFNIKLSEPDGLSSSRPLCLIHIIRGISKLSILWTKEAILPLSQLCIWYTIFMRSLLMSLLSNKLITLWINVINFLVPEFCRITLFQNPFPIRATGEIMQLSKTSNFR